MNWNWDFWKASTSDRTSTLRGWVCRKESGWSHILLLSPEHWQSLECPFSDSDRASGLDPGTGTLQQGVPCSRQRHYLGFGRDIGAHCHICSLSLSGSVKEQSQHCHTGSMISTSLELFSSFFSWLGDSSVSDFQNQSTYHRTKKNLELLNRSPDDLTGLAWTERAGFHGLPLWIALSIHGGLMDTKASVLKKRKKIDKNAKATVGY